MMLHKLKNSLINTSKVCSVEILVESSGELIFNWLILTKKNQVIALDKSGSEVKGIEHILTQVSADIPLVISISGKGVLHKKVEQQGHSQEKLFDYIFPNARVSDYLVQSLLCSDNSFYVSVIRKEQIDKLLAILSDRGYYVVNLSLGPFAVLPVLKLLSLEANELYAGRHKLKTVNYSPLSYTYDTTENATTFEFKIGEENIPSGLIVAYSNAFQYLVNVPNKVEIAYDLLSTAQQTYKDKELFKKISWGGLIMFFVILLVNAFCYTIVSDRNDELTAKYSGLQQLSVSNKKDIEDFNMKEQFLAKSGWLNAAALSYYSDRIASSLPDQIQLTSLLVSPFNESMSRKLKKEVFQHDLIVVKGIAAKPTELNQWTKELADFKWVGQVKVQDYTFDHKTSKGTFTLHINTSDELE